MLVRSGCSSHSEEKSSNRKLEKYRMVVNERTLRMEPEIAERQRARSGRGSREA